LSIIEILLQRRDTALPGESKHKHDPRLLRAQAGEYDGERVMRYLEVGGGLYRPLSEVKQKELTAES
jgi:hypothetical protein